MRPISAIWATVVLLGVVASAKDLNLLLLHNNDMHARFEETSRNSGTCNGKSCVGGFARTAHQIKKYRNLLAEETGSRALYLNAGDTYVGTAWFGVHKWRICADFLNALRPDAMSLGNHEFDFGVAGLAPFVQNVTFPIVAANLNFEKEPSLSSIQKSVVLEVSGRKIGVIGHLTPDTRLMSSPGNVEFLNVVESVRKESEVLDKQGVKIIIALGHSGFESDKQIAKEVPLVDVVIGGHTNTFLWNGDQPDLEIPEDLYPKVIEQASGKKVPVVQAYAYTKYLGVLNVTFDDNGDLVHFVGQPELLDTNVTQDPDMLKLLEKYRPEVDALDKKVVGKSHVILDANMNKCRSVECNIGNMMTDAMIYYMGEQYVGSEGWTDFPIGIVNGGSLRTTIDPTSRGGNITRGELLGCLPFSNQVVTLQLTGAELVKTLEIGARSNGETSRGEFLQFSGLHVVYNKNKPAFSRVVSVKVRCGKCKVPVYQPVVPDEIYGVVTLSFLSNGGDDHLALRDAKDKKVQDLDDVNLVEWYLEKQSPVYPEEQGRIQFADETPRDDPDVGAGAGKLRSSGALVLMVVYHFFNYFEVR